jgi:hypothetical protein
MGTVSTTSTTSTTATSVLATPAASVNAATTVPTPTAPVPVVPTAPSISQNRAESIIEASAPTIHDMVLKQQGLTEVSEADLRGLSEDSTGEKSATPESTETSEASTKSTAEDTAAADQAILDKVKAAKKTEQASDSTEETVKVPKGYVPIAAVHEVRGENKFLKEQIASLTAKVDAMSKAPVEPAKTEPNEFDNFVQLSDDEFLTLASDSPSEALLYVNKLNKFQEYTRQKSEELRKTQAEQEYLMNVYEKANQQMEEIVPGLFDAESPVATEFREFAVGLGFTEEMFYLTNPATRIILPGDTEPLLLGDQAADVIRLLANVKSKVSQTQNSTVDVGAIRAELRKEIEADILSKIKTNTPFKSISDIPASSDNRPEFKGKMLSAEELSRLSEKEQEMYLAGE